LNVMPGPQPAPNPSKKGFSSEALALWTFSVLAGVPVIGILVLLAVHGHPEALAVVIAGAATPFLFWIIRRPHLIRSSITRNLGGAGRDTEL